MQVVGQVLKQVFMEAGLKIESTSKGSYRRTTFQSTQGDCRSLSLINGELHSIASEMSGTSRAMPVIHGYPVSQESFRQWQEIAARLGADPEDPTSLELLGVVRDADTFEAEIGLAHARIALEP